MLYRNGKPFNRQAFAMGRDNVARGYIKGEHLPARKTKKPEKVSVPKSNLPAVIQHTIQGEGSIAETLYFVDSKELIVKFHSGAAFKFFDVEKVVNFGICHVEDADKFLCEVIYPKYRCEVMAA